MSPGLIVDTLMFSCLCLPSLCSVCLYCALSAFIVLCCHLHFRDAFLCDCTCCHAEDYKTGTLFCRFVILYAAVLNQMCVYCYCYPLWYSSLLLWLSDPMFVIVHNIQTINLLIYTCSRIIYCRAI